MRIHGKIFFFSLLFILVSFVALFFSNKTLAVSCTDSCSDEAGCRAVIEECTRQISTLQGQANTLKNQIAQFDTQIKLTRVKITETQNKINQLGGRIDQLKDSVNSLTQAFYARAAETYKLSKFENKFVFILSATDVADAQSRLHYLVKIQEEDNNLIQKLQNAKINYEEEKVDQETLQKELQKQQANLNSQKAAKNNLLSVTRNDEARYQSLLSQARAQLNSLRNFASARGGGVIAHRDLSDSWGKYYNQRDSNWGNNQIGLSSYAVWEVGCLLTSYAMVSTHFGGNITPGEVASNTGNFFSNTALFNSPGPSANGRTAIALENPSMDDLRNRLNSGAAIIAGLSANGGPYPKHYSDHWVVLRSVDGDSFRINDPWYEGAMNVSLNDHYSGWTIIQARVYY